MMRHADILELLQIMDEGAARDKDERDMRRERKEFEHMEKFIDYQEAARRTMPATNSDKDKLYHAVFGLNSEAGEVAGILQKEYQGHTVDEGHLIRELGDCLWMLAEACDALHITLCSLADVNVKKLRARYPDGFNAEQSLHRKPGDD